jgi:hypothetical protein
MKKTNKLISFAALIAFALGLFVLAGNGAVEAASEDQSVWDALKGQIVSDEDAVDAASRQNFREAVKDILNYFLTFLGLIAVAFIIYAGILMVTAGGEEDQVGKGKKIITWALVGIIIIVLSWTIVNWVANSVGAGV